MLVEDVRLHVRLACTLLLHLLTHIRIKQVIRLSL